MTAGSGVIHQEMPKGDANGLMWGSQLWANLPASHKMIPPRYREITSREIPEVSLGEGIKVKVVCGEVEGERGPVRDVVVEPEYLDVTVPAGIEFTHAIAGGHTAFAYVIDGEAYFDPERDAYAHEVVGSSYFDLERRCLCGPESLVLYEDGEEVVVAAGEVPVRFLLVSGKPIGEPVAWQGPIVMNTREELRIAFEEYEAGTLVREDRRR
jgi:hypothetical protein